MSNLNLSEQEQIRRESLVELRKLGIDPYPAALYLVDTLSTDIEANFEEGKKVIVVDPSPSPSFFKKGVEFEMISASEYVSKIIVN